ncbi:hypothetical protein C7999DRAFT_36983 [Corynascus novoguineensis]|uniref:Uncharacterized protein n=1 Tax=Corynascus novoguineensis TaxID=1126955 RepID=A0AAN7HP65_9PEZI|nr:hypothetical protein C7999DRAFT_36983 [Corynascus novoguineensis]
MDRDDPRQSIHEISLARRMVMSPGRAEMVTVSSPSLRDGSFSPQEFVSTETGYLRQIGVDDSASSVPQAQNSRPRVAFKEENDDWSMSPGPDCLHERPCGHKLDPGVMFKLDGSDSSENKMLETLSGTKGTEQMASKPTTPLFETSSFGSLCVETGEGTRSHTSSELPSIVGPFVLESISSGNPAAEIPVATSSDFMPAQVVGETKSSRALQKEYHELRTADWVMSLPPGVNSVPGHAPPLPALKNHDSAGLETMATSRQHPGESALRGNLVFLSRPSLESSPSTRCKQESRGVYLQLSLTDSQMDKLAAVLSSEDNSALSLPRGRFSNVEQNAYNVADTNIEDISPKGRSRSPATMYQSTNTPPCWRIQSPVKHKVCDTPESQRTHQGIQTSGRSVSPIKVQEVRFGRIAPTIHESPNRSGGRSIKSPPALIDTDLAQAHAQMVALRLGRQPAVVVHNPPERAPSPARLPTQYDMAEDSASSYYSQDSSRERHPPTINPLRIRREGGTRHLNILQEYTDKRNSVRGSDNGSEKLNKRATLKESASGPELAYTQLATFLPQEVPTARKTFKPLVGEGGWFENTSNLEQSESPNQGGSFIGSIVKKAKEFAANQDNRAQRKSRELDKSRSTSRQLAISLSPREQALLYCELEYILATALNDYITAQFNAGRLEADRLKKTAEDWQRKGRPRVVGFRYDMETQLDLVRAHVHDFKFYSRVAATTAILGIIDTAKSNARVLHIRTFCQPDTVIAKQLLDSQSLFNILGCPEEQQIKLAEIIAFFKAAIERRRLHSLHQHQLQQQQQQQQHNQPHYQQQQGNGLAAAATLPMHKSRSPRQSGGDDYW